MERRLRVGTGTGKQCEKSENRLTGRLPPIFGWVCRIGGRSLTLGPAERAFSRDAAKAG